MSDGEPISLRTILGTRGNLGERYLCGLKARIRLSDLLRGSTLQGRLAELSGRSVLLKTKDQFATALALIQLDGVARRIVVCPPCLPPDHLPGVIADAETDAAVTESKGELGPELDIDLRILCSSRIGP